MLQLAAAAFISAARIQRSSRSFTAGLANSTASPFSGSPQKGGGGKVTSRDERPGMSGGGVLPSLLAGVFLEGDAKDARHLAEDLCIGDGLAAFIVVDDTRLLVDLLG